jgi:hypothetical protein
MIDNDCFNGHEFSPLYKLRWHEYLQFTATMIKYFSLSFGLLGCILAASLVVQI